MTLLRFLPRRWWSPSAWFAWKDYMHWRLETYGAYYPRNTLSRRSLSLLVKQFPSYYRWLNQLDHLRLRAHDSSRRSDQ